MDFIRCKPIELFFFFSKYFEMLIFISWLIFFFLSVSYQHSYTDSVTDSLAITKTLKWKFSWAVALYRLCDKICQTLQHGNSNNLYYWKFKPCSMVFTYIDWVTCAYSVIDFRSEEIISLTTWSDFTLFYRSRVVRYRGSQPYAKSSTECEENMESCIFWFKWPTEHFFLIFFRFFF